MIRLHHFPKSSASYRVRIALALKGLDYESIPVDLRAAEHATDAYRLLNPDGLVPLLEDGDVRVSQSMAMIEYLEECYPQPALLPSTAPERARVRGLAQLVACDIHPLNNLRVLQYLIGSMGVSRPDKDRWYAHWISEGMAALERRLAEPATGDFCHGNTPGLADCFLVPQVINANRMAVDLSAFPRVRAIADRCLNLPAFQASKLD
ncbi:maleylacetoacetate isomerase [beta proteobacterium MWH-UniP1]